MIAQNKVQNFRNKLQNLLPKNREELELVTDPENIDDNQRPEEQNKILVEVDQNES